MSEDVYAKPDLTKKVRYRPRDREGETEDKGDWEEMIVDIYATADFPDRNPDPKPDPDPGPGTEQDAARNNTAQQQRGAPKELKQNLYVAVVVVVCGLLLLAGIIVLLILYGPLQSSFDVLTNRHDNLTDHFDKLETRLNNMTEQTGQLLTRLTNMTDQRDQLQTSYDESETRLNTMTDQRDQWKTSYDELLSRHDNLTELKRILCESHGFTLGGDGCYYISTKGKTWEDSRAFCTARQSDLMTIKSQGKQDFVDRLVGRGKSVWFGLTDREKEGEWKWVDGTPLTTPKYWEYWQPNGHFGEDCAVFYNGEWHDWTCGPTTYWMCEIVF